MEKQADAGQIEFGGPSRYRIVVAGNLPADWNERLAGMTISTSGSMFGEQAGATLDGTLLDQAQLNGVLDTLYNLHLTILNVVQVDDRDA